MAADITIVQPHRLTMDQARDAVQRVADQMAGDFEMVSEWQGDVLAFRRSGVSGTLALDGGVARLEMTIGLLLKAFAPAIRNKVAANMAVVFGAA